MAIDNRDEARAWADAHHHWSEFASYLYDSVRDAFRTLETIRFGAPWKTPAGGRGRRGACADPVRLAVSGTRPRSRPRGPA